MTGTVRPKNNGYSTAKSPVRTSGTARVDSISNNYSYKVGSRDASATKDENEEIRVFKGPFNLECLTSREPQGVIRDMNKAVEHLNLHAKK